jgi:hypothetical protein
LKWRERGSEPDNAFSRQDGKQREKEGIKMKFGGPKGYK